MAMLSTAGQLQQLLYALQRMRIAIPEFTSIISLFSNFLEKVYTTTGKRTKRATARIQLSTID